MNIISASRRTDIPAAYSDWFMNRLRAGCARYRNPFGGQEHEVSLQPQDVAAIVFWSRDYRPMMKHFTELDARGYAYYLHLTLTGLPRTFEPRAPSEDEGVEGFLALAERLGADRIQWRFDPIIFSNATPPRFWLASFERLCRRLEGATRRCIFSFVDFYAKVTRNLTSLGEKTGIACANPANGERQRLATELAGIAEAHGIALYACCEDLLVDGRVRKAHCVDADLIAELFPDRAMRVRRLPTRPECGCSESRDIGAYDTCPHGCVYCYANTNSSLARRRSETASPEALMAGGD